METSAPEFAHGDVASRLADLLRLASYRWKQRITPLDVANATGLDPKTVRQMSREDPRKQTQDYYFRTLRLICWYFETGIPDLLVWRPPATDPPRSPGDPVIRRVGPPTDRPPEGLFLESGIFPRLTGRKRAEVARATGLRFQTISDLLDGAHPPTRINRRTLAALCHYLRVDLGDLLWCSEANESVGEREGVVKSRPTEQ